MTKTMLVILILFIGLVAAAAALLFFLTPAELRDTTTLGFKIRSQTWGGTITVKGDVFFAPWATLTLTPGTKVLFDKDPDIEGTEWSSSADAYIKDHDDPTGRIGYEKSHFSIFGTVKAVGTKGQLIVFTSAQVKPEYADWDQLVLRKNSRLEYVELAYAHNGANVDGPNVTIMNSIIHDSLWSCIDIFSAGVTIVGNEVYHCWHQAIGTKASGDIVINGNNVHDAYLSVNCEERSKPSITSNTFTAAPISPDCGQPESNTFRERAPNVPGGTYGGKLIYPAS